MPECYECGAAIERGAGCRRVVQTGASVRVYVSRRSGSSFGAQSGMRTVCSTCAKVIDQVAAGAGIRLFWYFLGWCFSAWIGWQLLGGTSGLEKIIGVGFLLGLPPIVLGAIFEKGRQEAIRDRVFLDAGNRDDVMLDGYDPHALRADETTDAWLERILPIYQNGIDRAVWGRIVAVYPPRVGQRVTDWIVAWPDWEKIWPDNPEEAVTVFRADDTILSWADRVAVHLGAQSGADVGTVREGLLSMAKYTKPRPGEEVREFHARAQARIHELSQSLNPEVLVFCEEEPPRMWVERIAPYCLIVDAGECIEDVIPAVVRIAERAPPQPGESAQAWFDRVGPHIAEANAASGWA